MNTPSSPGLTNKGNNTNAGGRMGGSGTEARQDGRAGGDTAAKPLPETTPDEQGQRREGPKAEDPKDRDARGGEETPTPPAPMNVDPLRG